MLVTNVRHPHDFRGDLAAMIGSAHVGVAKGHRNLLCVDMGGTSYDMSLVIDGEAPAEAGWNMHHRYLIGVPMVKVETLGAGGGSIGLGVGGGGSGPRSIELSRPSTNE